ncbi:hypothetical protein ACFL9U_17725 [Thermodesulfobacteriota bacterium]
MTTLFVRELEHPGRYTCAHNAKARLVGELKSSRYGEYARWCGSIEISYWQRRHSRESGNPGKSAGYGFRCSPE